MIRKILILILLVSLSLTKAFGDGWHDYELKIDDEYSLFRNNSIAVCIGNKNGGIILFPSDYEEVGPVVGYQVTDAFILTQNKGIKNRNLFEGDNFKEINYEKDFFFIIQKKDNIVFGPFNEIEFKKLAKEREIGIKEWLIPKNPNFWRPFLGDLMFLAFAIPILMIKFFYVTIPLLFFTGWIIYKKMKKHNKSNPEDGQ